MTSDIYVATVNAINSALLTASITTLTFTYRKDLVVSGAPYSDLIDYIGYVLDSQSLTVNAIIAAELAKQGAWSNVASTARPVTTPSAPLNDHFVTLNGYYINNIDLPLSTVQMNQFTTEVEAATKGLSTTIQNKAKSISYSVITESATAIITDTTPTGTKVVTSTVTVKIFKAP